MKKSCWTMSLLVGEFVAFGLAPTGAPAGEQDVAALAKEVATKGWIVYGARSPKGDWDLFIMRPDGSAIRDITNTPGSGEAAPRFSPDGTKLLYRRLPKDAKIDHDKWGFQGNLIIANADGANPIVIGQEGEYPWAAWSPDGKQVSCLTKKGILVVDLATKKQVRQIPRKGFYQQLFWSPDGTWFCGVANLLGQNWTVARMGATSGEVNAVNTYQNCTPDWFPDSKRLIFSHRPGNQDGYGYTQLWMADGDGKNRRLVFGEDGRHMYGGCVSPDGKYVLFTSGPKDGSGSDTDGAPMHLMRLADTPAIAGESKALRKIHPNTKDGPVLSLPMGWEPHWTYAQIGGTK
ncbi:MAG: PD40 domain-containing protein [Phycisphaerae bacterium]|nr:PD40 domain-containing protein [Phycisphaerae bacterium]